MSNFVLMFICLFFLGWLIAMLPIMFIITGLVYIGAISEFQIINISIWWGAIVGILVVRHAMENINEQVFRRHVDLSSKLLEDENYPRKQNELLMRVTAHMNDTFFPMTMGLKFPLTTVLFICIIAIAPKWLINILLSVPHDQGLLIFIPVALGVMIGTFIAGWYYHQPEIVMAEREKVFLKQMETMAKPPTATHNT